MAVMHVEHLARLQQVTSRLQVRYKYVTSGLQGGQLSMLNGLTLSKATAHLSRELVESSGRR